jgi:acetyltransferase-like isoleucine patch superfamily enzyme
MISQTKHNTAPPFRVIDSTVIGIPSPRAIRADQFPGVRLGSDYDIGHNCVIFGNVFIGNNFRCGNDVLIRDSASIGDNVTIGDNCFIDTEVSILSGATIERDVCVPNSTTIGERVFVGPKVKFLSEFSPRTSSRHKIPGIILEDGCTIGANVVLSPGVCIGAGSRIAAGAVVTQAIPPNVYASGNPVRFRAIAD